MINVELHADQLYEAISISVDFFTKYAGHSKEFIIFDSRLYIHNVGINIGDLFTVANSDYTVSQKLDGRMIGPDPDFEVDIPEPLYVSLSAIPNSYFTASSALSGAVPTDGITKMQIIDETTYAMMTSYNVNLVDIFQQSYQKPFTVQCENVENVESFNNMFDYDIMDQRKVIDVVSFEEGSTAGVNTLFSVEQTMAQQSFHAYSLGNYGFDILSWHTVKEWMDTREKMFATRRDVHFDSRTQYLRMIPQPRNTQFYGLLECYVEDPLRDIIKEKWVYEYATAIAKVMWGRILTKINGVELLGGGNLNGGQVLEEGLGEKKDLEDMLVEGGFGDFDPVGFIVM